MLENRLKNYKQWEILIRKKYLTLKRQKKIKFSQIFLKTLHKKTKTQTIITETKVHKSNEYII